MSKKSSAEGKPGAAAPVRLRPRRPCPVCEKPSQQKYHPFCSGRCADVDLHRWLGGSYRVPVEDEPDFANVNDDTLSPGRDNVGDD